MYKLLERVIEALIILGLAVILTGCANTTRGFGQAMKGVGNVVSGFGIDIEEAVNSQQGKRID